MAKQINIGSMSGPAVCLTILQEAGTNIAFFGFGMVVILIIAEFLCGGLHSRCLRDLLC
jgi:hypothetical protein